VGNSAINAIRKLIDSLEKDDLHILTRVKAFANDIFTTSPEMSGAAKNILHIVKRVVRHCLPCSRRFATTA
jgi:son of sevenless-like protein